MSQVQTVIGRLRPALGTLVAIEVRADTLALAEQALTAAFRAVAQVDMLMHPTRAGSDLARLNAATAGECLLVHRWTAATLRLSRRLHRLSAGAFEPALPGCGSILHFAPLGACGLRVLRPARLDLGGIAKGYAVDRAVAALRRVGASGGLVNAGGDLRVFGPARWPLVLRTHGQADQLLILQDAALAASDPAAPNRPLEHCGYRAPRTSGDDYRPAATAVIARSATLADALTKIVMFAPAAQTRALLARVGASTVAASAA
jgi:thiamine biosynthesis lipoprotein